MEDFEAVYERYFKTVFLFAKSLSGDDIIAEEITQDTFFKALKAIDRFEGRCDIRVWLCQIAKNSYYTQHKNQRHSADLFACEAAGDRSPEESFLLSERSDAAHKALHRLPEPYKEVFSLRIFAELSFPQIARLFQKSESWARVTFYRAKLKLMDLCKEDKYEQT